MSRDDHSNQTFQVGDKVAFTQGVGRSGVYQVVDMDAELYHLDLIHPQYSTPAIQKNHSLKVKGQWLKPHNAQSR